jgi:hypothetical protein
MENDNNEEVLLTILKALKGLDVDTQKRTLQAVSTFLGISLVSYEIGHAKQNESNSNLKSSDVYFSANRQITAKEFLRDKMPMTDVERIACLAYYLTHYKDTPYFKTLDLSTLNTEAAQPKLSNATYAVDNATKAGFLVQAVKGAKQLSAKGELFVQTLPDRDAAKASIANFKIRKRSKKTPTRGSNQN